MRRHGNIQAYYTINMTAWLSNRECNIATRVPHIFSHIKISSARWVIVSDGAPPSFPLMIVVFTLLHLRLISKTCLNGSQCWNHLLLFVGRRRQSDGIFAIQVTILEEGKKKIKINKDSRGFQHKAAAAETHTTSPYCCTIQASRIRWHFSVLTPIPILCTQQHKTKKYKKKRDSSHLLYCGWHSFGNFGWTVP